MLRTTTNLIAIIYMIGIGPCAATRENYCKQRYIKKRIVDNSSTGNTRQHAVYCTENMTAHIFLFPMKIYLEFLVTNGFPECIDSAKHMVWCIKTTSIKTFLWFHVLKKQMFKMLSWIIHRSKIYHDWINNSIFFQELRKSI